jgi:hypothetical protein
LQGLRTRPVVVIAGAGVTAATVTSPIVSWTGLLRQFIDTHDPVGDEQSFASKQAALAVEHPKAAHLVSAATLLRDAWGQELFYRWIGQQFRLLDVAERRPNVINAIGAFDCPILTTNFDTLIGDTLQRKPQVLEETEQGIGIINNEYPDVLHLHGYHVKPSSLVIDAVGYERVLAHQNAQDLLTNLASKTLLFIGCGSTVEDPNIGSLHKLLTRLSQFDASVNHFRLVRERDGRPSGGVVTDLVYGTGFDDLEPFLLSIRDAVWRGRPGGPVTPPAAPAAAAPAPADLRLQIDGPNITLACTTTDLDAPFTSRPDWARMATIERLEAMLYAPGPEAPVEQMVEIAKLLGNHLLMMYGTTLAGALQALPTDRPCRLVLDLLDDQARRRPWECLYSSAHVPEEPSEGFIARSLDLSIVRAGVARRQPAFPKREDKPLKVLLAIADPHDSLKAHDLHDALMGLGPDVVSVQPPDPEHQLVTVGTIRDALKTWSETDQRPVDILHVVARLAAGDRPPHLELDNDERLGLDNLGPPLEAHPPRLVVLQLQPAERVDPSAVLDAAYAASKSGVPNLIAVQHHGGHPSTTDHVKVLYAALHKGERLDRALQLARSRYLDTHQFIDSVCFPALLAELGHEDLFTVDRVRQPEAAKPDVVGQAPAQPAADPRAYSPRPAGPPAMGSPAKASFEVVPRTAFPETKYAATRDGSGAAGTTKDYQ